MMIILLFNFILFIGACPFDYQPQCDQEYISGEDFEGIILDVNCDHNVISSKWPRFTPTKDEVLEFEELLHKNIKELNEKEMERKFWIESLEMYDKLHQYKRVYVGARFNGIRKIEAFLYQEDLLDDWKTYNGLTEDLGSLTDILFISYEVDSKEITGFQFKY